MLLKVLPQTRREPYVLLDHLPVKYKEAFTQWLKGKHIKADNDFQSTTLSDYVSWKTLYDKGLASLANDGNSGTAISNNDNVHK